MNLKVHNLGSKRSRLHKAYVIGLYNNLGTTVLDQFRVDMKV